MALTKKQKELDVAKWLKSEEIGKDACGSYSYCESCDKTKENPCDKALKLYNKIKKLNEQPIEKKVKVTAKKAKK